MLNRIMKRLVVCLAVGFVVSTMPHPASAFLIQETFGDDPVAAGRATVTGNLSRFTPGAGTLTAAYDTALSTTKMLWSLGTTFTQNTSFRYDVRFSMSNIQADPNAFAQISFGLINSTTTGDNRAGGPTFDGVNGSSYDIVTADYFPNVSTFGGPTLGPTVIETDDGVSGFFPSFDDPATPNIDESTPGSIVFPFGDETDLTTEGSLPQDTMINMSLAYNATNRLLTLSVPGRDVNSDGSGNVSGGADGDINTIESVLPGGAEFSVDSFAILLWEDSFGAGASTVLADVTFDEFVIIPEPSSVALLAVATVWCVGRLRYRV